MIGEKTTFDENVEADAVKYERFDRKRERGKTNRDFYDLRLLLTNIDQLFDFYKFINDSDLVSTEKKKAVQDLLVDLCTTFTDSIKNMVLVRVLV